MNDELPIPAPFCGLDPSIEDFETEPLSGLCALPAHLMTEEQMRQHVMQIQQHRQSFQTHKAEVEAYEREQERVDPKRKASKEKKPKDLKEFDELF